MTRLLVLILLAPMSLRADALSDLRTSLAQLPATTPVHGQFDVTSTNTNSEEEKAFEGKASVSFETGDAGLRIVYSKAALAQANQEARAEAADPDRQTPVRSGMSRVHALELADLLDAAAKLNVDLQNAQLIGVKTVPIRGRPTRLVTLRLSPKLSKSASKHVKKIEATLLLWLGDDGIPIAGERTVYVKASFMLMSFENNQKENWTFTRAGDRLVATTHEETQKGDGLGQHTASRVVQSVRLDQP